MTFNNIDRPSHYAEGRNYEPIAVIEDWKLNYRLGNAVKYISRAGRKDPSKTAEDLKKAVWYLEREIASLEGAQTPYSVAYEDVLEDYAACAAEGYDFHLDYGNSGNIYLANDKDWVDFWDIDDGYMWDPTVGPVELTAQEIAEALENKDLDQFEGDEIVRTFERRGLIFGVKKDGSSCILGDNGKCSQ